MTDGELLALRVTAMAGQVQRDAARVFLTKWADPIPRWRSLLTLGSLGRWSVMRRW
jgi:hypothetical protein